MRSLRNQYVVVVVKVESFQKSCIHTSLEFRAMDELAALATKSSYKSLAFKAVLAVLAKYSCLTTYFF